MRQQFTSPRGFARSQISHVRLLGASRRARDLCRTDMSGTTAFSPDDSSLRSRSHVLGFKTSAALGIRRSANHLSEGLSFQPSESVPPITHLYYVAEAVDERDCGYDSGSRMPDPVVLMTQAGKTARVLDVLTRRSPHLLRTLPASPPGIFAPSETDAQTPGAQLLLDLEVCNADSSTGPWSHSKEEAPSDEIPSVIDIDDSSLLATSLQHPIQDRIEQEMAFARDIYQETEGPRDEWIVGIPSSFPWPQDLSECPGKDSMLEPAIREEAAVEPLSPRSCQATPQAGPVVRHSATNVRPSQAETTTSPIVDKTSECGQPAIPKWLADKYATARTMGFDEGVTLVTERRKEAQLKRRQQLLRKALAQRQKSAESVGSSSTTPTPKPVRLTWRPGDPFAGWSRRQPVHRFRWHAMILTAVGVAGFGYLALSLLMIGGIVP